MKVGILTFHRADNCGAVLQCYALQEAIKDMGHEVCVIDYRQPYIEKFYSVIPRLYPRSTFFCRLYRNILGKFCYSQFRGRYLNISHKINGGDFSECDVYVIGSDQVWSDECTGGFDDVYFGLFNRPAHSRVVGYSVSCPLSAIDRFGVGRLLKHLSNFYKISFREKALADHAADLTGCRCIATVDPTLLVESAVWERFISPAASGKVLVCLYQYRLGKDERRVVMTKAGEIAGQIGTDVEDISGKIYDPLLFLRKIRNASYVITNSFHAVAFSLIFKRNFAAVTSEDGLDSRYVDLLRAVGADAALTTPANLRYLTNFNYNLIDGSISELSSRSKNFLSEAIAGKYE